MVVDHDLAARSERNDDDVGRDQRPAAVEADQDVEVAGGEVQGDGSWVHTYDLFGTEPFRSLALSIRLVYMNGETAK